MSMRVVSQWFLGFTLVAISFGCAVGPDPVAPEFPVPASFQGVFSVDPSTRATVRTTVWWEGFEDTQLTELITAALDRNLDLASARADLVAVRALRRAARADLLPTFDAFVDAQLTRVRAGDSQTTSDETAGALLFFDANLFGRQRRSLQAATANLASATLGVADLERLIARDVALLYIEQRRASARLTLLDTALELQQRTLEIVRARYGAGLSPKLDVDRSAADLARTGARRGPLLESQRSSEYALAVLLGNAPELGLIANPASNEETILIPAFKEGAPVGIPADVVRVRPDVRAAEANFIAATALIGVELADLYPRLTLPGSIRADLGSVSSIADQATLGLAAVLDLPLFDGGRRRAEVAAARAGADSALAAYQQTLLVSLQEVEAALVRIDTQLDRQARLAESVAASRSAYEQLNALYKEGLAGFIDVLDVQRTLIANQEAFLDSEATVASAIVVLYAALGGVTKTT